MLAEVARKSYVFLTGAFIYSVIEIVSRGFTHWSMAITGGICLLLLNEVYTRMSELALWRKCLLGSLIITAVEFTAGNIVNIVMDWNVWDYSHMPLNLFGQVCLPFTMLWFLLCVPAKLICDLLNKRVFVTEIADD